ncbi:MULTISPECIES: efflux RND transporter permease subunit [Marinobacter]|jgi:multidrug efflux pump subunit AcrB|uniref:Acriflavin resistance protein n=2 Tax=Marinobacter nauticus TaxID=2743 RepID=A1U0I7_MARN8|nr:MULTISPECIES: efflux RND transporter permease subunit [Marinobacter]MCS5574752.1 efflux RND transporter permease subunit [Pseudomonadales bacterium]MEC8898865.1 efflux RND transporter permease subunit [Pseudomonadota bacterium]ABM18506.1 acriflavin resistance protein [Marinobacter nauticus VT8]MAC24031.1 AcrB/AcrD/AcrF family protein [Marinobacter sp.]MEC9041534.1 efflux RND transporter permease subunit [Pseudomonadota bacterium]|tara:strand:- start:660 stop:3710 length:3051 start_codon:yes stop_codon:yes gene_type:complete
MVDYFLDRKSISWMVTLLLGVGGMFAFLGLGQLEFPEFTLRSALVTTQYPGATPLEVEEEVTLPLEKAIQQMPGIDDITSVNSDGLSQITVQLKKTVREGELDQYWDILRRKINDAQPGLPPGVNTSIVNDDFGDVFGLLLTLRGDGYSLKDLGDHADLIQRELRLLEGVAKVSIGGRVDEQMIVSLDRDRMRALGISPEYLASLLNAQNTVGNAGHLRSEGLSLSVQPTGQLDSVQALEQLAVGSADSGIIRLSDLAEVRRVTNDSPALLYHSDGLPALTIGVSFAEGTNVVDVGESLNEALKRLEKQQPIGMTLNTVYNQPEVVEEAVSAFLMNLAQAVGIVIIVLLLFMGLRSGLLMGLILLITIMGTFVLMAIHGIQLQKISLGALIIALGMLVDNAIVVTEGMMIGLSKGKSKRQAAKEVVSQNRYPLLGATVIAITAFAPIGLSPDTTGEFIGSLFWVLCYSLFLSWLTALTLTPFFFDMFYPDKLESVGQSSDNDPYKGIVFVVFRRLLTYAIHYRFVTLTLAIALLAGVLSFSGQVKNAFFPNATTPLFFVDLWLPEGADILQTEETVKRLESRVNDMDQVVQVTSVTGGGAQRFTLTYSPEQRYASFGQLIVETRDKASREARMEEVIEQLRTDFPNVHYKVQALQVGPSAKASLEARIFGEDPEELRKIGVRVQAIFENEPLADSVRLSWGNREAVIVPEFLEEQARRLGVSRESLHQALLLNNQGQQVGVYREGSDLIPIIMRSREEQRFDIENLTSINVWSEEQGRYVSAGNVINAINTELRDPLIKRRNRERMLAVYAEPMPLSGETAASVLERIRPQVDALELPHGYSIEWGGEYETSSEAQTSLFSSLPLGLLGMFIISMLLFGSFRQALSIWMIVPLMMIGIIGGLVLLGAPFTFMALLGTLSLIGMVLKNAIVLVEEINIQLEQQDDAFTAVVEAAVSRVRPVLMAAVTTMLGMIPLFSDAFFASMAVVIVCGLGVATVLTLVVLPVVYCTLMRISYHQ